MVRKQKPTMEDFMMAAKKPKIMTKLLKNVDGEIYRRFRAYCILHKMTMGQAISALMQCVLEGHIDLDIPDSGDINVYRNQ